MDNKVLSATASRQGSERALLADYKADTADSAPFGHSELPPATTQFEARFSKRAIAGVVSAAALLFIVAASFWMPTPECIHGMGGFQQPDKVDIPSDGRIDPTRVFLNIPSTDQLRENLLYYSSGTHVAGINSTQAAYTRDYFEQQGIESKIVEYFPWLNYPVDQRVTLFNETTQGIVFEAGLKEDVVPGDPLSEDPNNLPAFHGYSADGNVTGQLVYANYGRLEDFKALKAAGISVVDKIVLVRYGYIFRGVKVHIAELNGAKGVLIYSDPADDGYSKGKVYPAGPWRPESSIQRGSVMRLQVYPGDPLTPGYAATKDAPRIDPKDAKNLNHIPSLPLSYRDAEPLLCALQGHGRNASEVGSAWIGGLTSKGVEYWTGPSKLSVNLLNKIEYKTRAIQNVIGRIKGSENSEHTVIVGNHRDAWCSGASDPSSGSAALLELARALGELMKLGWRPRRTIILASWDAEEYGLVGSTEWVEDNIDWVRTNAVAYINVDSAVGGGDFKAEASPAFEQLLYDVTKQVPYPHSNGSVYDAWLQQPLASAELANQAADDYTDMADVADALKSPTPLIRPLGSGSDYTAFMAHAGVSSLSMGFSGRSGAYHSNYDSPKRLTTFIDPDMQLHQAMVRVWGLVAIKLADDPVICLSPVNYAKTLRRYIRQLEGHVGAQLNNTLSDKQAQNGAIAAASKIHHLRAAQRQLLSSARAIEREKAHLRTVYGEDCQMGSRRRHTSCIKLRSSINDRAFSLERHFTEPEGIPNREWFKHVLVAPGRWEGYGAQVFPALAEAAEDGDWKRFQLYSKRTVETIYEAAWFLREV
ncbi:Vacuolar protein sorting-associated protein 70 [Kickxella alabastrina]|uniref:Vacuolar protein sorting-associated protein 70 n=1 Tax=Kickxella alabastrina TaxID=61397 RepID=A0ACC1IND0_9FUNG|nr:Vacuolar protein sorting-associated protein 70 [Kickxella alabastrina]